tara:strand:- start:3300 stop:3518 length:219 start_codon:yes stop_codon:yes gene_type:complete
LAGLTPATPELLHQMIWYVVLLLVPHFWHYRNTVYGTGQNMTAYGIAAIAHNLHKGAKFLTLYGLPEPNYAG